MKIVLPIKLTILMMFLTLILVKIPNAVFAGPLQGMDANVYSDNGTNWQIYLSNDESVFQKGTSVNLKLVVYACRANNDTWCAGDSPDYIAGSKKELNFQVTLPGKNDPDMDLGVKAIQMDVDCGRLQGDLVPEDESNINTVIGGSIFAFSNSCPEPPAPPNSPAPSNTPITPGVTNTPAATATPVPGSISGECSGDNRSFVVKNDSNARVCTHAKYTNNNDFAWQGGCVDPNGGTFSHTVDNNREFEWFTEDPGGNQSHGKKTCGGGSSPGNPADNPPGNPSATPTPAQPTALATQGSQRRTVTSTPGEVQALRWVCLDMKPCSNTDGTKKDYCTDRGNYRDKVILQTKTDANGAVIGVQPNSQTWIFECVIKDGRRICTNGIDTETDRKYVGQVFAGTNNLDYLKSQENYRHTTNNFYYPSADLIVLNPFQPGTGKRIPGSNPPRTYYFNLDGKIGPFEWSSYTKSDLNRLFLAMNVVVSGSTDASNTTQLNSTFFSENSDKSCVMISWDPYGTVFDIDTLEPIKGASVTLLKKNANNKFIKVEDRDVLIGIQNPQTTLEDGHYDFRVEDGVYKLEVSVPDYQFTDDLNEINQDAKEKYKSIYDGGEIVIKDGKQKEFNIAMKKIKKNNSFEELMNWFSTFLTKVSL